MNAEDAPPEDAARPPRGALTWADKLTEDLELDELMLLVEEHCASSAGRRAVARLPMESAAAANLEHGRVWSCRRARAQVGSLRFACEAAPEVAQRVRIEGLVLPAEDLVLVWDGAVAAHEVRDQVAGRREGWEDFGAEVDALPDLPAFRTRCGRTFDRRGGILDDATPRLAEIRRRQRQLQQSIEGELQTILRSDARRFLSDEFVTRRDGRWVVPVQANHRGRIKGVVVSSSKTGATIYVEPMRVLELSNELRAAEAEEAAEVHAILEDLTAMLAQDADQVETMIRGLAELDALHARAAFADQHRAHEVAFSEDGRVDLRQARHLLLGDSCVPIDITLPAGTRVLVLSGANAGGKTVALKTLATLSYLAACGHHVPVGEGSRTVFPGHLFCVIGDEQSLAHHLSSFSSHVSAVSAVLREARAGDMVLLDELMGGTDPEEGSSLAVELLLALAARGTLTVVTTHYSVLKTLAQEQPHFENACVEFDETAFRPTFRILAGSAGPSRGFEIARRYGMPEALVERARHRLGPERARLEEMLRGVESDRLDAALALRDAEKLRGELAAKQVELERLQRELKEKVYVEAQERAAALDSELTALRRRVLEALEEDRVGEAARLVEETAAHQEELPAPPEKEGWEALELGDRVRVAGYGVVGEIVTLDRERRRATVDTGAIQVEADLTRCESVGGGAPTPPPRRVLAASPRSPRRDGPLILTEVMLVGMRALEARETLERELDQALAKNADGLRVIHGFGTGTLKAMVWELLRGHGLIAEVRPGGEHEGGRGATVAVFR